MKTHLLAATLMFALTGPVLAQSGFYIVLDKQTGKCSMSTTAPTETEKITGRLAEDSQSSAIRARIA
jgi:hypothetical protein